MYFMFAQATDFNHDLSNWSVETVTDMDSMFREARAFNQELCWSLNARVTTIDIFLDSGGGSFGSSCP
jgi:hypothetical protein